MCVIVLIDFATRFYKKITYNDTSKTKKKKKKEKQIKSILIKRCFADEIDSEIKFKNLTGYISLYISIYLSIYLSI